MENLMLALLFATFILVLLFWMKARRKPSPPNAAVDALQKLAADTGSSSAHDWRELADEICAQVFPDADPAELKDIFARYHFKLSKNHGFAHDAPADVVADVVKQLYPMREPEVWQILQRYNKPVLGVQVSRVHLDILKASGGKFEALDPLAKQANQDVRELLSVAEAPNATKALMQSLASAAGDLGDQLRYAADEDLKQFVAWHRALPAGK